MAEDPAVERAAAAAALGHRGNPSPAAVEDLLQATGDHDGRVRAAALGALVRAGTARQAAQAWEQAVVDGDARVRRRAADLAPALAAPAATIPALTSLLTDTDVTVVTAAAWALGEHGNAVPPESIAALASTTTQHKDPRAREAAVAALGALGHQAGLEAILRACQDKPAVRRRAVLALASYEGPEVEAAIQAATKDKDWQTRQAAEDLLLAPEPKD